MKKKRGETKMNIGLFVLLIFVLILSGWAFFRQYNYQRLLQHEEVPKLKEKIKAYRIFIHEKQIITLLTINAFLVFSLIICIVSIYKLENRSDQLQKVTQTYEQMQTKQNDKIQELQKKAGIGATTFASSMKQEKTTSQESETKNKKSSLSTKKEVGLSTSSKTTTVTQK